MLTNNRFSHINTMFTIQIAGQNDTVVFRSTPSVKQNSPCRCNTGMGNFNNSFLLYLP